MAAVTTSSVAGVPSIRVMLDTNVASAIIRGAASDVLRSRLRAHSPGSVCISAITEGELRYGLAKRPQATALAVAVEAFLRYVEVLAWDRTCAATYGQLRAALETAGTPLGALDTLIAAHALTAGCMLATRDQAFRQVPQLHMDDWSTTAP